jgi:hypothetical protein
MKNHRHLQLLVSLMLSALALPAWGQVQNSRRAQPGTINYVEGHATIGPQELSASSEGNVDLQNGQTLATQDGKVEVLLTPGVFLRVAPNSAVKMVSADLANTEVAVTAGRAMVEVADISKDNNIRVDVNESSTRLLDKGLYDFDAALNDVRVFKGKAQLVDMDQRVKISGSHKVTLNASGKLKSVDFDTRQNEDDFFRWCALRSGYLSEASAEEAREYIGTGPGWYGPGWYGTGWYWDPWFDSYTFVPADGIFYSPFGWGFYSPIFIYHSPFFYGGFYGRAHSFGDVHEPYGHGFEPRGGFQGGVGGFHGGGGFQGGGFHGGGGGRR